MKLSEMKSLLAEHQIQLTKSLGQNFLHDQNQLRRIVKLADVQPGEFVLEIGPGLGPLTDELLKEGAHVLAIEKDQRLCDVLRQRLSATRHLELIHADALDFLRDQNRDWTHAKLVSNLPYSVASPILVELAQSKHKPQALIATLQLEVAQRIMASHGTEHYGLLTLLLQLHFRPESSFRIPATSFFPAPDVDSACIKLARREECLLPPNLTTQFKQLIKRSFSQRRKMMLKLLKADWPASRLQEAFDALAIPPKARAEEVALEQFVELTRILNQP